MDTKCMSVLLLMANQNNGEPCHSAINEFPILRTFLSHEFSLERKKKC